MGIFCCSKAVIYFICDKIHKIIKINLIITDLELLKKIVPVDIFLKQVTYLPFGSVVSFCQTNKLYHSYCTDTKYDSRWKNLIYNTFGHLYGYKDILNRLWKKLGYPKNKYDYIVYVKLVELLDPITQLMIYCKQDDMESLNDKKFNDVQRFLAMVLLGNISEMNKYLPHDYYLPFISWVEGKKLSQGNLNEMLSIMLKYGNPLGFKLLLEEGADIHARNYKGLTEASRRGHTETAILLLKYGADVHVDNDSPLMEASKYGHIETAILLLKYGADIHGMIEL